MCSRALGLFDHTPLSAQRDNPPLIAAAGQRLARPPSAAILFLLLGGRHVWKCCQVILAVVTICEFGLGAPAFVPPSGLGRSGGKPRAALVPPSTSSGPSARLPWAGLWWAFGSPEARSLFIKNDDRQYSCVAGLQPRGSVSHDRRGRPRLENRPRRILILPVIIFCEKRASFRRAKGPAQASPGQASRRP